MFFVEKNMKSSLIALHLLWFGTYLNTLSGNCCQIAGLIYIYMSVACWRSNKKGNPTIFLTVLQHQCMIPISQSYDANSFTFAIAYDMYAIVHYLNSLINFDHSLIEYREVHVYYFVSLLILFLSFYQYQ